MIKDLFSWQIWKGKYKVTQYWLIVFIVVFMHTAGSSCRRWLARTQVYSDLGYTHALTLTHKDVHSPTHALTSTHVHAYICTQWHHRTHSPAQTHTCTRTFLCQGQCFSSSLPFIGSLGVIVCDRCMVVPCLVERGLTDCDLIEWG